MSVDQLRPPHSHNIHLKRAPTVPGGRCRPNHRDEELKSRLNKRAQAGQPPRPDYSPIRFGIDNYPSRLTYQVSRAGSIVSGAVISFELIKVALGSVGFKDGATNPVHNALAGKGENPALTLSVEAPTNAEDYGITLKPTGDPGNPDKQPKPTGTKGKGISGHARESNTPNMGCDDPCNLCLTGKGTLIEGGSCQCTNGNIIPPASDACAANTSSGVDSASGSRNSTSGGSQGSQESGSSVALTGTSGSGETAPPWPSWLQSIFDLLGNSGPENNNLGSTSIPSPSSVGQPGYTEKGTVSTQSVNEDFNLGEELKKYGRAYILELCVAGLLAVGYAAHVMRVEKFVGNLLHPVRTIGGATEQQMHNTASMKHHTGGRYDGVPDSEEELQEYYSVIEESTLLRLLNKITGNKKEHELRKEAVYSKISDRHQGRATRQRSRMLANDMAHEAFLNGDVPELQKLENQGNEFARGYLDELRSKGINVG